MSISIHGPIAFDGTYNVIGIKDGLFFLQGNLTEAQLRELAKQIKATLKK